MDALRTLLEQQQVLTIFLVIGLGYALGELSLRGFSLGVGAVLFVGLALGALAPKAAPPVLIQSIGLVLFLYGIGIQYGKQFFAGLTGAEGRRWNLLSLLALLVGAAIAVAEIALGLPLPYVVGLFAGGLTSTSALQAALDASGSSDPSVGYGVSYPFGVIGPILCFYAAVSLLKPKLDPPSGSGIKVMQLRVERDAVVGRTVGEVTALLPAGVQITAVRQGGVNKLAALGLRLAKGDDLLLAGSPDLIEGARQVVGPHVDDVMLDDPQTFDYLRVFVSKWGLVGRMCGDLRLPETLQASLVHVQRGDAYLFPRADLTVEYGDRVGVITKFENFPKVRAFFGDSIKSTAEFSYVSMGIGMVLGVVVGLLRVPVPGLGSFSLGLAGGPLIVALVLGYLGRTGPLTWVMPTTANLTLRNFGLTLFLAVVGLRSGPVFVDAVQQTGLQLLLAGGAITLGVTIAALLLGHYLFRLAFDDLLGVVSGVTGNPAILAFASRTAPTDKPDIGYAIIFPAATILKIIIVQVLVALLG